MIGYDAMYTIPDIVCVVKHRGRWWRLERGVDAAALGLPRIDGGKARVRHQLARHGRRFRDLPLLDTISVKAGRPRPDRFVVYVAKSRLGVTPRRYVVRREPSGRLVAE